MSNNHIIRAWKDATYRNSLSEAERAALPPNPAGAIEISNADLGKVAGGVAPPETHDCSMVCTLLCTHLECSALCSLACPTFLCKAL